MKGSFSTTIWRVSECITGMMARESGSHSSGTIECSAYTEVFTWPGQGVVHIQNALLNQVNMTSGLSRGPGTRIKCMAAASSS